MEEDEDDISINLSVHSSLITSFYSVPMFKFTTPSCTVNEDARPVQMRVTRHDGTATGSLVVKTMYM